MAFVHLESEGQARVWFARYGLPNAHRVSNPTGELYRAFGLARGTGKQLLGFGVLRRWLKSVLSGHGFGLPAGDARQMPGAFLLFRGEILKSFRHATPADRPDYVAIATPN